MLLCHVSMIFNVNHQHNRSYHTIPRSVCLRSLFPEPLCNYRFILKQWTCWGRIVPGVQQSWGLSHVMLWFESPQIYMSSHVMHLPDYLFCFLPSSRVCVVWFHDLCHHSSRIYPHNSPENVNKSKKQDKKTGCQELSQQP